MKLLIPSLAMALAACGSNSGDEQSAAHPLESLYAATLPEGAVEVNDLRGLENGDKVVVRGDVQDVEPVSGKAALNLFDHRLKSCDETEDDMCPTPWDFCCEDPDAIAVGRAFVEFREGGKLVAASLKGFHGLDYLSDVVVSGTLNIDDQANVTIIADAIHVEGQ